MVEVQKLANLRAKLVTRRRKLAQSMQDVPADQLTGLTLAHIQGAIEAIDRAMIDEREAELKAAESRAHP